LLDEGFMSGTHTAVGLHDAGCTVEVLAATGGRGECVRDGLRWRLAPAVESEAFLRTVDDCVRDGAFNAVLPLTEPIQRRLWAAAPSWRDRIFPRVDAERRALLDSKLRVAGLAAAIGVPVPRQLTLRGGADLADDVRRGVRTLGLPIVVKGVRGRGGSATRIADSAERAVAAAQELGARGECFLQQYVRGATYLVGGLFRRGRPLRLYAAEKLELHPARTGPSIALRSVREPQLVASALLLFEALELDGLASMDFVRGSGGTFHFLEVNPRPGGSIAAAAAAGVDLFTPLAQLLRGEEPRAELGYRAGVSTRVFPLYLLATAHWRGLRALSEAAADLRDVQGLPWRRPAQALHLLHRLTRVAANWRSH
jgi:hypothetical protein